MQRQSRSSASGQISFGWVEPDAITLANRAREFIEVARARPRGTTGVLISCGRNKSAKRTTAGKLYTSARFQSAMALADRLKLPSFILSAKHGVLKPNDTVEPYDLNLGDLSPEDRSQWAERVFSTLTAKHRKLSQIVALAADGYLQPIEKLFGETSRVQLCKPLQDLPDSALELFTRACGRHLDREETVFELYKQLERSSQKSIRTLRDAVQGRLPTQGVYYFFDPTEPSAFSKKLGRLVRVGTHGVSVGSKSTLKDRLRTHLGTADGLGNHRSSVFRLHIGEAIIRRDGLRAKFPEWGVGQQSSAEVRQSEKPLEQLVSETISNLLVACISVEDQSNKQSARSTIERLSIALFTENFVPVERPSDGWLGLHSQHATIATTGLWNLRDAGSKADFKITSMIKERL